jgi:hypothetical protein
VQLFTHAAAQDFEGVLINIKTPPIAIGTSGVLLKMPAMAIGT